MNRQEIIDSWNAQADEYNQWDDLGEDEKLEWAMQMEREAWPSLEPVINWLENGCNPKDAVAELRLYDAAIRARGQQ